MNVLCTNELCGIQYTCAYNRKYLQRSYIVKKLFLQQIILSVGDKCKALSADILCSVKGPG